MYTENMLLVCLFVNSFTGMAICYRHHHHRYDKNGENRSRSRWRGQSQR